MSRLAIGSVLLLSLLPVPAFAQSSAAVKPPAAAKASGVPAAEALARLTDGNRRFVAGRSQAPHRDRARILETAPVQKPFAVIVGCSDSRVPSEILFDQGIGDLFVVRTAGQVSADASYGSIEYAVEVLGAKLVVVMGHTKCGAVKAALEKPAVPGHIATLVSAISPAADRARTQPGDPLDNAVRENVRTQVRELAALEPVLSKRVKEGAVKVIGAVYDVSSGNVTFLP